MSTHNDAARDAKYRDPSVGSVHTPMAMSREIVAAMDAALFAPGKTFLDPACGSGNLLVAVAERRLSLGVTPSDVAATTFGVDINAEAVSEALDRLSLLLGEENRSTMAANFDVRDWLTTN
jgi:ubiquinone/menaquinone biosynthesis C-methylase UbiE